MGPDGYFVIMRVEREFTRRRGREGNSEGCGGRDGISHPDGLQMVPEGPGSMDPVQLP